MCMHGPAAVGMAISLTPDLQRWFSDLWLFWAFERVVGRYHPPLKDSFGTILTNDRRARKLE